MTTRDYILLSVALFMTYIGIGIFTQMICEWLRIRKVKHSKPNELDSLVRQERVNQAVPLVALIATNLPVDVRSITLTLHYSATESLTMDCGRPQEMQSVDQ